MTMQFTVATEPAPTQLDHLETLRISWLERQAAAKKHWREGNMDRRETALEELYGLEDEIFKAIRDYGSGFSITEAEEVLRIMTCGLSVSDAIQAVIDTERDQDERQMQTALAHGF